MKRNDYNTQYQELVRQMYAEIDIIRKKHSDLLRDLNNKNKDEKGKK